MSNIVEQDDLGTIVRSLERRLRALETQPLRQLYSGVSDPSVKLDLNVPALTVTDAAHTQRVVLGLLTDGTTGVQIRDASGALILDTVGLRAVMTDLGPALFTATAAQPFATAWTGISATNAAFSITRTQNVLILGSCSFTASAGTAAYGYVRLGLLNTGGTIAASSPATVALGQFANGFCYLFVSQLPAGAYTAQYQYRMDAGATTTLTIGTAVAGGTIDVFQMGG